MTDKKQTPRGSDKPAGEKKLSENLRKGWHAISGGSNSNPPTGGSGGSDSTAKLTGGGGGGDGKAPAPKSQDN